MGRGVQIAIVWLAATAPVAAWERVFDLELAPQSGGLERTLTGWLDYGLDEPNGLLDEAELRALDAIYGARTSAPTDVRQKFRRVFADKLPSDLGGYGFYLRLETPLGTVSRYSERFRGNDDLDAEFVDRRAAVDRLADLIVGWLDMRLEDSPHRDAAHRFADTQLRQDLRKLAATTWLMLIDLDDVNADVRIEAERKAGYDTMQRILHYLVERRYLLPDESEHLGMLLDGEGEFEDLAALAKLILARGCRLEDRQADEAFDIFGDPDSFQESLTVYLRTTPEYAQLRKRLKTPRDAVDADLPDALAVLQELTDQAFQREESRSSYDLSVKLQLPIEPYLTNGEFDRVDRVVRWSRRVRQIGLPTYCYAVWTEPNAAFQKEHFGRTIWDGKELLRFAGYFERLEKPYRERLAEHLAGMKPGDDGLKKLTRFKLDDDAGDEAHRIVEQLMEVLSEGL